CSSLKPSLKSMRISFCGISCSTAYSRVCGLSITSTCTSQYTSALLGFLFRMEYMILDSISFLLLALVKYTRWEAKTGTDWSSLSSAIIGKYGRISTKRTKLFFILRAPYQANITLNRVLASNKVNHPPCVNFIKFPARNTTSIVKYNTPKITIHILDICTRNKNTHIKMVVVINVKLIANP